MSINVAKWITLFLFVLPEQTFTVWLFTLFRWPRWQLFELLPFLVHRSLRIRRFSSQMGHVGIKLRTKSFDHDDVIIHLLVEWVPRRFLV